MTDQTPSLKTQPKRSKTTIIARIAFAPRRARGQSRSAVNGGRLCPRSTQADGISSLCSARQLIRRRCRSRKSRGGQPLGLRAQRERLSAKVGSASQSPYRRHELQRRRDETPARRRPVFPRAAGADGHVQDPPCHDHYGWQRHRICRGLVFDRGQQVQRPDWLDRQDVLESARKRVGSRSCSSSSSSRRDPSSHPRARTRRDGRSSDLPSHPTRERYLR